MTNRLVRTASAACLFALLSFAPSSARADDEAPSVTRTRTYWYGWQTLLVDAGTVGATLATRSPLVFAGGFTLGAPIVHWAHGNVARGFASLGLRIAVPVVTAFTVGALDRPDVPTGREESNALAWGILGGGLLASALDAALLARTVEVTAPRHEAAPRWRVEPRIGASPRGAFAGLGGSF